MADPPNKMASVTVDELLGMAHDAYARARVSPDASTKQKLTRLADDYLKQAKDMRRGLPHMSAFGGKADSAP
jgi:hypothetical protein